MTSSKIKSKRPRGVLQRYHPVVNFWFRPVYKALGGRYNPLVAENTVGAMSFVFHLGLFSFLNGSIESYMEDGDLKKVGVATALATIFPVVHYFLAKEKNKSLLEEKAEYMLELESQGETENLSAKVEEEFQRRKEEYAKIPKFYTGFEKD